MLKVGLFKSLSLSGSLHFVRPCVFLHSQGEARTFPQPIKGGIIRPDWVEQICNQAKTLAVVRQQQQWTEVSNKPPTNALPRTDYTDARTIKRLCGSGSAAADLNVLLGLCSRRHFICLLKPVRSFPEHNSEEAGLILLCNTGWRNLLCFTKVQIYHFLISNFYIYFLSWFRKYWHFFSQNGPKY